MTYYLKYRPQTLDELDSVEVKNSLKRIVTSGNIPHAFLFAGPKGTGKTSAARIIAKIVNCEHPKKDKTPCNECEECKSIIKGSNIDVVEIDAASNRGIDDIRALRDSIKLSPVRGKKKIYIIDEAHMLTSEASNALLKTLEEPPDHALFVLATTNPEKILKTIHSRVTEISFKRATPTEISVSLEKIVKGEKLKLGKDIIDLVSGNSDGSFRDATKYIEQIVSEGMNDVSLIEKWITGKTESVLDHMIKLLVKRDDRSLIRVIEEAGSRGESIKKLIDGILGLIKNSILAKSGIGEDSIPDITKDDLFTLVDLLLKAEDRTNISLIEELPLEIAIIKWCEDDRVVNEKNEEVAKVVQKKEEKRREDEDGETNKGGEREKVKKDSSKNEGNNENILPENKSDIGSTSMDDVSGEKVSTLGNELSMEDWKKVLAAVRPINTSIEALLRAAKPVCFDGKTLTLGVYYKFHKEKLEEDKYRRLLEGIISKVLSVETRLLCTLTTPPQKQIIERKTEETVVLKETEVLLTKNEDNDIIEMAKKMFSSSE